MWVCFFRGYTGVVTTPTAKPTQFNYQNMVWSSYNREELVGGSELEELLTFENGQFLVVISNFSKESCSKPLQTKPKH